MNEREAQVMYRLENMVNRFHNGEFPDGRGAERILAEMTALGLTPSAIYEYLGKHSIYLAESNNGYTKHQFRRWDELVVHAERILGENGFELPQEGSRHSDFKLVPIGSSAELDDFSDIVF